MRTDDQHRHGKEIDTSNMSNPQTVHEESDINVRAILMFGFWLFVAGVVIHAVLWGFFRLMEKRAAADDPRPSPVAEQRSNKFPEPKLQPDPVEDVQRLRAREDQQLNQYGWVNRQQGVTHMPIERAMELVVQRGLPTRAAQPQPPMGSPDSSGGAGPNKPEAASPRSDSHGQREAEGKPATPATRQKPRQP